MNNNQTFNSMTENCTDSEMIRIHPATILKFIEEFCYERGILRKGAEAKKMDSIVDDILACVIRSNVTMGKLYDFSDDVKDDLVFKTEFFYNGGNVFDYINPKWRRFAQNLWKKTPKGLGTPCAACGEGELMFLMLSKHISKPKKGDLYVANFGNTELKGEEARIMGTVDGKEFRIKTLKMIDRFSVLTPNPSSRNMLPAVELEKKVQYEKHWKTEFKINLTLSSQRLFIKNWLECVYPDVSNEVIDRIFFNNVFNHDILVKEIVKLLFTDMIKNRQFNALILLGDGTNCKIIKDQTTFNLMIDNNNIILGTDYFRINQSAKIGWYVS